MKLGTFIIGFIFVPGLALAQEMTIRENVPINMKEQTVSPQPQTSPYQQIAYVAPSDKAFIELNATTTRKIFKSDSALYSESTRTNRSEAGIIQDWRERMFKILGTYPALRETALADGERLQSKNELDEQASERKTVARTVLKETLKFTQERLPEIDKLVKSLKLEFSTDMLERKKTDTIKENADDEAFEKKTGEEGTARHLIAQDKFYLKTGLRIPVDNGRLGIVSETDAKYGNMSAFFKVHLDGQFDNSVGLVYVLGRDLSLQAERQVSHTTDLVTNDTTNTKSDLNMVKLVCTF